MYTIFASALQFGLACWLFNAGLNLLAPLQKAFPHSWLLNAPLDWRLVLPDGHRLVGDSITVLGIVLMFLMPFPLSLIAGEPLWLVALKCACASAGGILGSFVKRRLGMPRGKFLPLVDHGDYMIVTVACFIAFDLVDPLVGLVALVGTYIVHPMVCVVAYLLKIKSEPY
jgi:CDP-2,3-bis-(O-geranylgeranyl)-sn-glycerol synthase